MGSSGRIMILKLLGQAAIVLSFTLAIVWGLSTGRIDGNTDVPVWLERGLMMLFSVGSFAWLILCLIILASVHKVFIGVGKFRKYVRNVFIFVLGLAVGKIYWWAGLAFGLEVLSRKSSLIPVDASYLVIGFGCWLAGISLWIIVKQVAYKVFRMEKWLFL